MNWCSHPSASELQQKHTMLDDNVQVQREVEERMGIWQIEVVCKVLEGIDVITIAANIYSIYHLLHLSYTGPLL